jgi:hypothetical protein
VASLSQNCIIPQDFYIDNLGTGLRKQLVQTGALPVEQGDQDEEQESTRSKKSLYSSSATAALSDDEDDEYDDRGYTNI